MMVVKKGCAAVKPYLPVLLVVGLMVFLASSSWAVYTAQDFTTATDNATAEATAAIQKGGGLLLTVVTIAIGFRIFAGWLRKLAR